jgi:hypothetical protein
MSTSAHPRPVANPIQGEASLKNERKPRASQACDGALDGAASK